MSLWHLFCQICWVDLYHLSWPPTDISVNSGILQRFSYRVNSELLKLRNEKKKIKDPLRTTVSNKFLIRPYTLYLMGRILVYNQDFKSDILKMLSQVQKLFIITMFHVKFKILIPCISFYNFLSIRTRRVGVTTYIPICQFNWLCRRLFITDH